MEALENSYNCIYSVNAVAPVLSYRLDKMEKMN
ncbi:hypothetical protein J2T02_004020 [Chitinophaga terrae (ex Kim and Jung 2007)]|nr:hypothetical protein [Chitinophaga terrae (ex Kim and Jung 2007)]